MKKIFFKFIVVFFILGIVGFSVFLSPIGEKFLKNYVVEKLCLTDKLSLKFFNYSFNSFSLILNKKDNTVQIFGNLYPFNAVYSANFSDLNTLWPYLQGKLHSNGKIKIKNQKTIVDGNLIIAKGFGKVNLNCDKNNIKGTVELQKLNTLKFLSMIKDFKLPFFKKIPFEGENDLNLTFNNNYSIYSVFNGNILLNKYKILSKIIVSMNLNTINNFSFKSKIFSKDIKGVIIGNKKDNVLSFNANFDYFNLKFLQDLLLYPIKSKVPLSINYISDSNVILFKSNFFNGDYKKRNFSIQFKTNSSNFFKVLSLIEIINGDVSGNIYIDDLKEKGTFNILLKNASFNSIPLIKKIEQKTGINLENSKGIFFLNGEFNKKRVVFNLISKEHKYLFIIKNGIYDYSGILSMNIKISSSKKEVFLKIFNNRIKIINVKYKNKPTETLVI